MEIRINKEIKDYHESLFFGLSTRQFICSVAAVGAAVGIYFGLKNYIDKETVSWLCIVTAAPIAVAGFFNYNGMNFEEFIGAWFRSEFLAAGVRKFESTNYLYEIVKEELDNGNIQSVRKKKQNKKAKAKNCKDGTTVDSD